MHEITVSPTIASVLFVLSACSFTKICHWREIHNDWTTSIVSSRQVAKGIGSLLLFPVLNINIAHHVVSQVVTDIKRLNFSIFAEFLKQIFIEVLKVLLNPTRIDGIPLRINTRGDHIRALVHVREKKSGADAGLGVKP